MPQTFVAGDSGAPAGGRRTRCFGGVIAGAVLAVLAPSFAPAQVITLTEEQLRRYVDALTRAAEPAKRASGVGMPSGYTAAPGSLTLSVSGTSRRAGSTSGDEDGSLAVVAGFGDPGAAIGVEAGVSITAIGSNEEPLRDFPKDFGNSGSLFLGASRAFQVDDVDFSVAARATDLLGWGDADGGPEGSVALTAVRAFLADGESYPVAFTIGAGTAVADEGDDPGVFFGLGLGVSSRASVGAGFVGDEVVIGATFWLNRTGLEGPVATIAVNDPTYAEGRQRVTLTLSYTFENLFNFGAFR